MLRTPHTEINTNKPTPFHTHTVREREWDRERFIRLPIGSCEFRINIYTCDVSQPKDFVIRKAISIAFILDARFPICATFAWIFRWVCIWVWVRILFDYNMVILYTQAGAVLYLFDSILDWSSGRPSDFHDARGSVLHKLNPVCRSAVLPVCPAGIKVYRKIMSISVIGKYVRYLAIR